MGDAVILLLFTVKKAKGKTMARGDTVTLTENDSNASKIIV